MSDRNSIQVQKLHTLLGHKDALYTMQAKNDQQFFSAGGDGSVVLWNLDDSDGTMMAKVNSSIYGMYYDKSDDTLVVGENFSGIHLLSVGDKKEKGSVQITKSAIFDVRRVNENYWVGTGDGEVIVVDPKLNVLHKSKSTDKSARCIDFLAEKNEVIVGFSDNSLKIYNSESFEVVWQIEAHQNSVFTAVVHPNKEYVLTGSRDAHLKIWNTSDYQLYESIVAHMYAINHIAFSPSGEHFVTCSMDKSIKVWDANTFRLLKVIDKSRHAGHGTSVNKLLWIDDEIVVSCSDDRTVSVWKITIAD